MQFTDSVGNLIRNRNCHICKWYRNSQCDVFTYHDGALHIGLFQRHRRYSRCHYGERLFGFASFLDLRRNHNQFNVHLRERHLPLRNDKPNNYNRTNILQHIRHEHHLRNQQQPG